MSVMVITAEKRSFMTEVGKYYILVSCQSELRRSACAVL